MPHRIGICVSIGLLGCVGSPVVAVAQAGPDRTRPIAPLGWYAGASTGVTFGASPNVALAGEFGLQVGRSLFVTGEAGRMRDVLPQSVRDDFDTLLAGDVGQGDAINIRLLSDYAFGGIRWRPPSAGRLTPFVDVGAGVAHVSPAIDKAVIGGLDVTAEVRQLLSEGSAVTKPLLALGFGVTMQVADTAAIDVGYRYTHIATEDPAINVGMLYVAFKASR